MSRPALSQRFPLPAQQADSSLKIDHKAALDADFERVDDQFIFSPIVCYLWSYDLTLDAHDTLQLTLPPSFGSAYVGETFSCTLCANNELPAGAGRVVTSIKIGAEMQTPSLTVPLNLEPSDDGLEKSQVEPGESLQKTVRFDLREEGSHVLAVSLSYSETTISKENSASSGRVRSFRKLYQFSSQPCLSVRTKVSDIPSAPASNEKQQYSTVTRFALEAQLENLADGPVTLEKVTFNPKPLFTSKSLNWDVIEPDGEHVDFPVVMPREVMQVAFLIEQQHDPPELPPREADRSGRTILGQLGIRWRTAMGDSGYLSTGWLMEKRR